MPKQPKPQVRQGNLLGEEYPSDPWREAGERMSYTADDDVLEGRGFSYERRSSRVGEEVARIDE